MKRIAQKVSLIGGEVTGPDFHPPREVSQIADIETTLQLELPEDFAHFLTEMCGGWRFSWDCLELLDSNKIEDIFPGSPSGGSKESEFIGPSNISLVALYHEQIELVSEWLDHGTVDASDFEIVKHCIPLYNCFLGSDIIALRLDTSPNQVVYLDHESGFHITPAHILGRGFTEFITRYVSAGCPDLDYLSSIYNVNREIDAKLPDVERWVNWLAD